MSQTQSANLNALTIDRSASGSTPSSRKKYIILGVILLVVASVIGLILQGGFPTEVQVASVAQMSPSQANMVLTANGYVVAQRKAAVSSKVTGRLVELLVVEGDRIRSGQIIGRIESADVLALVEQLRAALVLSQADVVNAEADVAETELDFNRRSALKKENAISQMEYDVALTKFNKAKAFLNARKASVNMAQANLRNAEVQLENTIIRAPFDGTVLTKNANVGEVITALGASAGSRGAVVTLADMASLQVEADVSESKIERISVKQPCEIVVDAYPEKRYKAEVSKIIPTADRGKATVQVKVQFAERDERVLPEMSAKVLFLKASADPNAAERLIVPTSSVVLRDGKQVVFRIQGETAEMIAVTTGDAVDSFTEIKQGITRGDNVIVRPDEKLQTGAKIKVK